MSYQSRGEATARVSAKVAWHEAQSGLPRGASPSVPFFLARVVLVHDAVTVRDSAPGWASIAFLDNARSTLLLAFHFLGNDESGPSCNNINLAP